MAWHNREREEVVFITEIMTGGSLKQYLKRIQNPHLRVIKQWCKGILEGLKYLHSTKPYPLIHRDLKCDNIFVSSSTGDIRIGDLGLSTFMKNSHNKTMLGTPEYMAPELYEEHYGPSIDIYSFGLCVLEMCTHSRPYSECKTPLEIYQKVVSGKKPQAFDRILNQDVKEFIELCLTPVDQRPHADELLNHRFLVIDENDGKVHLPVSLKMEEETGKEKSEKEKEKEQTIEKGKEERENEVKIELKIGFREPTTQKIFSTKIDFSYNLNYDSPEGISNEIITNFSIDPSYFKSISQLVREKVLDSCKELEPELKKRLRTALTCELEDSKGTEPLEPPPFKETISKASTDLQKSEIIILQGALNRILGEKLAIDGVFGPRTENAIKKYQENTGVLADGIVKKQLWDQIMQQDTRKTQSDQSRIQHRSKRLNTFSHQKPDEKYK